MALNWEHNDHEREDWQALGPIRRKRLWLGLMSARMGHIKDEKDAEEFFVRLRMWEMVFGAGVTKVGEDGKSTVPQYVTLEEAKAAIGLSANIASETRAAFRRDLMAGLERTAEDVLRLGKRSLESKAAAS